VGLTLEEQCQLLARDDIMARVSASLMSVIASAYIAPALADPAQQAARIALVQSVVADPTIRDQIVQLAGWWVVSDDTLSSPEDLKDDGPITDKITLPALDQVAQAIGSQLVSGNIQATMSALRRR